MKRRSDRQSVADKRGQTATAPKEASAHPHLEKPATDHLQMVREMREKWLWTNATVAGLGLWLISSPFTFGYTRPAMVWSDVASGLVLAIFSVLAFSPR